MQKILAAALLVGGIGLLAFFGYQSIGGFFSPEQHDLSAPGDTGALRDQPRAGRRSKPLVAPTSCNSIRTGVFFDICQSQPNGEQMALPWDIDLNGFEEDCILEAFHATNRQVLERRQREYIPEQPSDSRVISFACDVAMAALSEQHLLIESSDSSASAALTTFFKERANTRHGSEIFY